MWQAMRRRCKYPSQQNYYLYGGRGIRVCEAWSESYEAFLADMGECPEGMTLDRINPDGHYEPGNCRWISNLHQQRNRRTNRRIEFRGVTRTLSEWAEAIGISQRALRNRIVDYNWPLDRALTEPASAKHAIPRPRRVNPGTETGTR